MPCHTFTNSMTRILEFLKRAVLLLSIIWCLLNVRAIGKRYMCDADSFRELLSYSSWGRKVKCKMPSQLFEGAVCAEF